jgi:hypothetical protein
VPYAGLDPTDIKEKVTKNPDLPSKIGLKKSILEISTFFTIIVNKCRNEDPKIRPSVKELKDFNEW